MDRRNHLMLPFLVSVAVAGALIGLVLREADPVAPLVASLGAVLLAHVYFFERSRD